MLSCCLFTFADFIRDDVQAAIKLKQVLQKQWTGGVTDLQRVRVYHFSIHMGRNIDC